MLATIKHLPGHGDTQTDSHIGMPVIGAGYPRLDSLELVPFRAGIAAGADVVMSAHIAFPALTGSNDPGTMSAAVRSEEHTSELQSHSDLVCRLLLEKKKNNQE